MPLQEVNFFKTLCYLLVTDYNLNNKEVEKQFSNLI